MSKQEAIPVIMALSEFEKDINELMDLIRDKRTISIDEKTKCQSKLKTLKEKLKHAAKTGTVNGAKRSLSHYESAYFQPAIMSALANCNVATNSHPINSKWFSCLYDINIDITHFLSQLTEQYPDI
ncbi:MAG: hypothetical protein PHE67_05385 [Campylobacterales bacterium]|nr:hypothetical protein [Campylobacterales bacterium]